MYPLTFPSNSRCISLSHILPSFMSFFVVITNNKISSVNAAHTCMGVGTSTGHWKPTSGPVGTSSKDNDFPP